MRRSDAAALFVLAIGLPAAAAGQQPAPTLRCDEDAGWRDSQARFCEMREKTLPAASHLDVAVETNGSIRVHGSDRSDIRMLARVEAYARTEDDAKALASRITVMADRGNLRAGGPRSQRWSGRDWAVSYELWVPRRFDLRLRSFNGGIRVDSVQGDLDLHTLNGGLSLAAVAGDVRGETTNGGLHVSLAGNRWMGAGLDLRTTNGGVVLEVPKGYSARLETATVNGGFDFDFPITVQGSFGRHLTTQLGSGGATLHVTTTNGTVAIRER